MSSIYTVFCDHLHFVAVVSRFPYNNMRRAGYFVCHCHPVFWSPLYCPMQIMGCVIITIIVIIDVIIIFAIIVIISARPPIELKRRQQIRRVAARSFCIIILIIYYNVEVGTRSHIKRIILSPELALPLRDVFQFRKCFDYPPRHLYTA